jgi:Fe-S cluster biosynthesis and repair protein YggX
MNTQERIDRFTRMTEVEPDSELAQLSLGQALADAGRFQEALPPLRRALELNPELSKAYQVLGEVRLELGRRAEAVETLRIGIDIADRRGDYMPRDAMAKMLSELGETPPTFKSQPAGQAVDPAEADFNCARCGTPSKRMEHAPFKGELGAQVHNTICQTCWREWVGMGTMVINEFRLDLSDPQAQEVYDQHMVEFLQLQA